MADIGWAIARMQSSKCVRRAGWNGKGMHIYLEDHLYRSMPRANAKGKVSFTNTEQYEPCIVLFTTKGTHQPGWNASTPDLLATDWELAPTD